MQLPIDDRRGNDRKPQSLKLQKNGIKTTKVLLTIHTDLLVMLDEAAENDYTTRSDIIRTALLWYLRPLGRDIDQNNIYTIISMVKYRQQIAKTNRWIRETFKNGSLRD